MKRVGQDHRHTFEILRSPAKDRSIIITRPDKGRRVVILDRSDYLKKMYTILDDPQSFRQIETDTTLLSDERLTNHLRRMKKAAFISEEEYSVERSVGSMSARIYGLSKLHKANCSLPGQSFRQRRRWATAWVKYWLDDWIIFDEHLT